MATGVKFTISGSDTEFEKDEIERVEIVPVQSFKIQERQLIKPDLYFEGNNWKTVNIQFRERWSTTRAKIETVIDADVEMKCYPYYQWCSTFYMNVILVPDNVVKIYRYGELEANISYNFTLLQSS